MCRSPPLHPPVVLKQRFRSGCAPPVHVLSTHPGAIIEMKGSDGGSRVEWMEEGRCNRADQDRRQQTVGGAGGDRGRDHADKEKTERRAGKASAAVLRLAAEGFAAGGREEAREEEKVIFWRVERGNYPRRGLDRRGNEHTDVSEKLKREHLSCVSALPGMCGHSLPRLFIPCSKLHLPFIIDWWQRAK